jgi:hypothetical protein
VIPPLATIKVLLDAITQQVSGVLASWKHDVCLAGIEALLPADWQPLTMRSQQVVIERIAQLGTLREKLDKGEEIPLADGFELMSYVFGKTGCPIVVVGLRQILQTINRIMFAIGIWYT